MRRARLLAGPSQKGTNIFGESPVHSPFLTLRRSGVLPESPLPVTVGVTVSRAHGRISYECDGCGGSAFRSVADRAGGVGAGAKHAGPAEKSGARIADERAAA